MSIRTKELGAGQPKLEELGMKRNRLSDSQKGLIFFNCLLISSGHGPLCEVKILKEIF